MKKTVSISLFWKFTIAITVTVALFGSVNFYFIHYAVYNTFEKELVKHGTITGEGIAQRGIDLILYDDIALLNKIVSDAKYIDSNVAYIFILDKDNRLLAHTFKTLFPRNLIRANYLKNGNEKNIVILKDAKNKKRVVRDMALPILDGNLGTVRIGLFEEGYFGDLKKISKVFLMMVIVFLAFGISGAFIFSYIITSPIKQISKQAEDLNFETLDIHHQREARFKESVVDKWKNLFNINDEIDILSEKFRDMIFRLNSTYRELQVAQTSLIQSEKMSSVGNLAAGIAHEINNPIAGIQNCIRRIREKPDDKTKTDEYLLMMEEAINKVEKVVQGILNYSRKTELEFRPVDFTKIINNVLKLTAYQLEKSNISVLTDFPSNIPSINGSSNYLEQVVLNLVINSVDAINEKKAEVENHAGEISFTVKTTSSSLIVEICDNGTGVPRAMLKSVFDPFFTLKKVRQGTGLGLSVCYNIVKQHKGEIIALNKEQGGMKFVISLPV